MSELLILGLIGFVGFACQWLAHRLRLPAILFLLLSGILIGPIFNLFSPNELFGDLLFPYISLSVAVILFEGALTLKRNELSGIAKPVRRMVTSGVLLNAAITTAATHFILGLSWEISALFGAIMVVTGPTVIMPMLKTVRPNSKVADALRWESIIVDPIGALVAVLVFEWIVVRNSAAGVSDIFTVFAATILAGAFIGVLFGYLFGLLLRNNLVPNSLQNFASLSLVCLAYAVSDSIMHESGLLAVTVMGVLLANMRGVEIHRILEFKEDLTIVFVSALFIVLAARLNLDALIGLGWGALALVAITQFVSRPLKVFFSFRKSDFTWQEKSIIAWIGPRGIVAAAVSAVFALKLEQLGVAGAESLVPLAFMIIIGTVIFQSLTAGQVARALDVIQPSSRGILILGANPFSVALAKAFQEEGVEATITDTNWDHLSAARIAGIDTYYGNPSSEHASLHLDLTPFEYFFGLSSHFENNVSVASNLKRDLGRDKLFVLAPDQSSDRYDRHLASTRNNGRILFNPETTFSELDQRQHEGAVVKATAISSEYSFDHWRQDNPSATAMLTCSEGRVTAVNFEGESFEVPDGHKLLFLT